MAVTVPGRRLRDVDVPRAGEDERHLRVVEPPRHRGLVRLVMLFVFVCAFTVLFGTVAFHVRLATGQQRIDRLDRQAEVAQKKFDRLRLEVDRLSAPDRIIARARALGMVETPDPTWLAPSPGTVHDGSGDATSELRAYLDVKPYLGDNK